MNDDTPSNDAITFHRLAALDDAARARLLERAEHDLAPFLERVRPIVEAVRDEGDAALARFARELDGAALEPDAIAATEADFERAFAALDARTLEVLKFSADNVRRFHEAQMPEAMWMREMHPGVFAGEKVVPIDSVACYVPRGKGSFPSVVLMTAIPASVAGVPEPIIVTPPGPTGDVDDATLVAARLAGVARVFKAGGAQGVAAAAYGTESVPRCLKMVGPGSPWVVAAKRLLADRLDTGTPAGPSEAIILADESANGHVAALDLLIESEHGPDSAAWLVTDSERVAREALAAIPGHWREMGAQRTAFSKAVLCGPRGGVLLCETIEDAIDFVNAYAPEHLQVHAASPYDYLGALRNAGEILLGEHTPICIGNYTLGPNAVLPTNGAARTRSPLGVHDYLKLVSIGHVTRKGYERLAPIVHDFARYEGFDAHANAVSGRRSRAFESVTHSLPRRHWAGDPNRRLPVAREGRWRGRKTLAPTIDQTRKASGERSAPPADDSPNRRPMARSVSDLQPDVEMPGHVVGSRWYPQTRENPVPDLNHGELSISSSDFDARAPIPERFAADGENLSPALSWDRVPDGAKELVIVVHDPDAPLVDGFVHWVATGIDPSSRALEAGVTSGFRAGTNSLGERGWTGMAPPPGHGVHHYFFHLYAIDTTLDALSGPTRRDVLDAIDGHIVEQARVVGTYALR